MFKKSLQILLLLLVILPINTFAMPKTLIVGGENIGIEVALNGVVVVGTYEVDSKNPAVTAGLKNGDIITKVNDISISSISEMTNLITDDEELSITFLRNGDLFNTTLIPVLSNGIIKTGLYVKDSVTGIGTLSFINPITKQYGALGHEITSKSTGNMLEIKNGKIFTSSVTNIERSIKGTPGAKNASFYNSDIVGTILKNTKTGIYGEYTGEITGKEYKVGTIDDIKLGKATIMTVTENDTVSEYEIEILKVNDDETNKNILFEITDSELLEKTGGVVQGMSGSPILLGEYIIGVVNYVIVENPNRGYGILITNMLEEMEE